MVNFGSQRIAANLPTVLLGVRERIGIYGYMFWMAVLVITPLRDQQSEKNMKQNNMQRFLEKNIVYIAWVQSIVATLGSLYYSEIKHYTPCTLCWYQRIFMYPLVIIIAVGILRKDKGVYKYVLPMSILGWSIALYHVLLQKGILPEAIAPCVLGASCKTEYTGYFGFITIPVMSLMAFTVITVCMLLLRKYANRLYNK